LPAKFGLTQDLSRRQPTTALQLRIVLLLLSQPLLLGVVQLLAPLLSGVYPLFGSLADRRFPAVRGFFQHPRGAICQTILRPWRLRCLGDRLFRAVRLVLRRTLPLGGLLPVVSQLLVGGCLPARLELGQRLLVDAVTASLMRARLR
jgi:hypothetical protein